MSWRATLLEAGAAESAGARVVNFEITYSNYSRVLLAGTIFSENGAIRQFR